MDRLHGALLVQCLPDEVDGVRQLTSGRPGAGVLVTTPDVESARRAAGPAGVRDVMVLDASRYAGARRLSASVPFRESWLDLQRELDLPVLTDSGYAGPEDHAGVTSVLDRTARLGPHVVATLALSPWWFDESGGLGFLLEQVERAGVPVAVALEHQRDPLGVRRTLCGLIRLIGVGVPVIQLRCDVSGLGLLCHGAWAAAVGTRSNLRHFYPTTKNTGGFAPRQARTATVVKECLSYIDVARIALAVQADPDDSLWLPCECAVCGYRTLDWLSTLPDAAQQRRAAFGHAWETLLDLRDALVAATSSPADRQASWRAHCENAIARFQGVNGGGASWSAPPFLRCWRSLPLATPTTSR
ncbi:MAG: hypothetical protein ACRDTG_33055 [Pseudonocardiaceae bacterium]